MIISNFSIPGQYAIQLIMDVSKENKLPYSVTYGLQTKAFVCPEEALVEFKQCVAHACVCAGWAALLLGAMAVYVVMAAIRNY